MADAPPEYTYTPPDITTSPPPLPNSANISIREYIYILPHPLPAGTPIPYTPGLPTKNPLNLAPHPFEPTNTLVLTSPARSFVDLRYHKPRHAHESALPNRGETERLEWGFAGRSASSTAEVSPHPVYGEVGHSVWTHWVDSRVQVGEEGDADEGDMYAISKTRTVEVGVAFHPEVGGVVGHEEGWVDVEVLSTTGTRSKAEATTTTTTTTTTTSKGRKFSVLLRCHADAHDARGVVLRVGQYCQGIITHGRKLATERWEFTTAANNVHNHTDTDTDTHTHTDTDITPPQPQEETGWRRTARTGDLFLPCAATFRPETLRLGGTVRFGALEWVVDELWEWVD